jgi:hypothetical protein
MLNIKKSAVFGILFCILLFVWKTNAQTASATLRVSVADEQNAVVPNAVIKIKNEQTSFERTAATNADGNFVFSQLPPSVYLITVEAQGFAVSQSKIVLNVNDQSSLRIQLRVSSVSAVVEVISNDLVTDSPAVSTVINRQFIANQPLNGRSFQNLVELSPGVVITPSNLPSPGQFSVNGQRTNSNYLTVDGVSGNFGTVAATIPYETGGSVPSYSVLGTTSSLASVDAVQEFSIQTSAYAPEFGRQPGAQISLVTRGGTNRFSGSVFYYLRNDVFDANNFFANANNLKRQPLRQNNFGGVFGGPIFKEQTFFFFSYEGLRLRQPFVTVPLQVPSLAARANATGVLRDLLNAFPLPTGPAFANNPNAAPYITNFTNPAELDATSFRIDHRFNDKVSIFGRYNYAPSQDQQRARFCATSCYGLITGKTQTLTLGSTMMFSSKIVNDLRVNFSKAKSNQTYFLDNFGGAIVPPKSSLYPSFTDGSNGFIYIEVDAAGDNTLSDGLFSDTRNRQFNIVNTLSYNIGNHALKFGADYRRISTVSFAGGYRRQFLPGSINALVQNTPSSGSIIAPSETRPIYDNFSLFAQDTWRVRPNLTLTYGIRYEIVPAPDEANGNLPPTISSSENLANATLIQNKRFYETTFSNFAPRIGIAYQIPKFGTTVRGGFGVFYDLGYGFSSNAFNPAIFPYASRVNFSNITYTSPQFAQPAPPVDTNPPFARIFAYEDGYKMPYTLQYNAAIEQAFGKSNTVSITYVGSVGRRLPRVEINRNPNPTFVRIDLTTNGAKSDYNALQVQYQRRLSRGLQAIASYTFAKSLDTVSDEVVGNLQSPTGRFPENIDRGPSSFDVRHAFNSAISYDIPSPFKSGIGKTIFGGFGLDVTFRARTATPVNVVSGVNRFNLGVATILRPDLVAGQPLYISDPTAAGGRRFNRDAFVVPPATENRQGNFGRNVLRGFGANQLDLSLRRTFGITERVNLQMRVDGFNIFNRANFANPSGVLSSGVFGRATRTLNNGLGGLGAAYQIGGPRSFQLSAKVNF